MKYLRHSLRVANHKILIQCDHKSLVYFQPSKVFSQRQAKWTKIVSSCDLVIEHLAGNTNLIRGPSWWSDSEIGYERPTLLHFAAITAIEHFVDLLPVIKTAQATNSLTTDENKNIFNIRMVSYPDLTVNGTVEGGMDTHKNWKVISRALTYNKRIYIPEPFRSTVIDLFLDSPESGHFGAHRMAQVKFGDFY